MIYNGITQICYFRPKSVNRKGRDDVIMMSWVHFYHYMINLFKSHQDRMRNDQVTSVNMPFLSEISEAERP